MHLYILLMLPLLFAAAINSNSQEIPQMQFQGCQDVPAGSYIAVGDPGQYDGDAIVAFFKTGSTCFTYKKNHEKFSAIKGSGKVFSDGVTYYNLPSTANKVSALSGTNESIGLKAAQPLAYSSRTGKNDNVYIDVSGNGYPFLDFAFKSDCRENSQVPTLPSNFEYVRVVKNFCYIRNTETKEFVMVNNLDEHYVKKNTKSKGYIRNFIELFELSGVEITLEDGYPQLIKDSEGQVLASVYKSGVNIAEDEDFGSYLLYENENNELAIAKGLAYKKENDGKEYTIAIKKDKTKAYVLSGLKKETQVFSYQTSDELSLMSHSNRLKVKCGRNEIETKILTNSCEAFKSQTPNSNIGILCADDCPLYYCKAEKKIISYYTLKNNRCEMAN